MGILYLSTRTVDPMDADLKLRSLHLILSIITASQLPVGAGGEEQPTPYCPLYPPPAELDWGGLRGFWWGDDMRLLH